MRKKRRTISFFQDRRSEKGWEGGGGQIKSLYGKTRYSKRESRSRNAASPRFLCPRKKNSAVFFIFSRSMKISYGADNGSRMSLLGSGNRMERNKEL